jgi:predicted HAD superfamily Cof-like phosphohydrolase
MSLSNYGDVHLFHRKFDLPHPKVPTLLDEDTKDHRYNFMQEELEEFDKACASGDLALAADALIDLVYVVMGTGVMMGLPWQALWDEVQRANLQKVRDLAQDTEYHRGLIKPPGWRPPDIEGVLMRYQALTMRLGEHGGLEPETLPIRYNGAEDMYQRHMDDVEKAGGTDPFIGDPNDR